MLLVEHDVAFVTRLADAVTVLDRGRVIAEGSPDEVRRDPHVIAVYLGQEDQAS
jgi:branched-chain amino acid transport system ATP-binding protein